MSSTLDYGIDLGTTNSCIARCEGSEVRIFQNNDQMNVTPSAVHVLRNGRVVVGRRAHAALLTDPDNVAVEFKRWMGQKDRKRFEAAGRELSAEELSAEVLRSLREDVRRQAEVDVVTAVITVPAAFGGLQCEATARAAKLAGFEQTTLLQEPIAAAVGYGASPDATGQRWLVFDLGGGTLDIAVVSTRGGRLNVLEHRGDNLLGGKDIDRTIVDQVLLPELQQSYALSSLAKDGAHHALMRRLRHKAEEAKLDLSTDAQVVISLTDIGRDDEGKPIEIDIPLSRAHLQSLIEPLIERSCNLALEALSCARLSAADLDRILLVGGPTRAPYLRAALGERLNAKVDASIDPMTAVGRGAALYAATTQRTKPDHKTTSASPKRVALRLAYEPVSAELTCPIAGRALDAPDDLELKLEEEGGLWTSGWLKPLDGLFEVTLTLRPGELTTYFVYARDGQGRALEVDTPELKLRHGIVPSAPPLPHTLSVEVLKDGRRAILDPVLPKGTPLPADKRVKYRASHALVPGKPETDLAIKLWEGEFHEEPEANQWVGKVVLAHDGIRRTLPEGSEIELTIHVSSSRLVTVDAFVPRLNQHFSGRLYVPQREEQDFASLADGVASQLDEYRVRLQRLEHGSVDEAARKELEDLRRDVDDLDLRARGGEPAGKTVDPDDARRQVERTKTVRGQLGRLEQRITAAGGSINGSQRMSLTSSAGQAVHELGTPLEKQEMSLLLRELERALAGGDARRADQTCEQIAALRFRVLARHDWFWRDGLEELARHKASCLNPAQADALVTKGRAAVSRGDSNALREAVMALSELRPKDAAYAARERVTLTGLRKA
jgi:molecular chaperone DnaK